MAGAGDNVKWVAALSALLGLSLLAAALRLDAPADLFWYHVVAGVLVTLLGAFNALSAARGHAERALLPAGLNLIAGLTTIAAPFLTGAAGTGIAAVDVIVGPLLAIAAGYNWWNAGEAHGDAAARAAG